MDAAPVRVLGIAGSLRRRSHNKALLRAAVALAPPGMEIETYDLAPLPFYDRDVEVEGDPPAVRDLKERVREADALLIATPEYNHSTSGVLKNAIDWASRPPERVLYHKPIAIMGATTGAWGTIRAQESLRTAFVYTQSYVLPGPEVLVADARQKFDEDGNLTDEQTREFLRQLLEALLEWARAFKA